MFGFLDLLVKIGNYRGSDIKFVRDSSFTTTSGTKAEENGYEIPIAFKNDDSYYGSWDSELKGLWISKYNIGIEQGSNVSLNSTNTYEYNKMYSENQSFKAVSKPYYIMWRNISFTRAFSQSLMFYKNVSTNGDINSHLMKYSEFTALYYLFHNPDLGKSTSPVGNYENTYAGGSDGVNGYSIKKYQGQSSNGNITGIFDLNGLCTYYYSLVTTDGSQGFLYDSNGKVILKGNKDDINSFQNKYLEAQWNSNDDKMQFNFRGNSTTTQYKGFSDIDEFTEKNFDESDYIFKNQVSFKIVIANSPAGNADNLIFDETDRIPSESEPGFFVTDNDGNYIKNSAGEYKDKDGNPTFYSWQTMIDNKWVVGDPNSGGSTITAYGGEKVDELKKKTGILIIPEGIYIIGSNSSFKTFNNWNKNESGGSLLKVVIPDSAKEIGERCF